ncbi:MAG: ABC transporter ATP-binding protein [Kiritimatiellia bacterium]|nr:ABC transporter ATP-binding protein [Kiritimatiellia bacterium]
MIEIENLTKVFRDFWRRPKVRAVDSLSFRVRRGEVFGLLGPNGSGKSTTLKMLLGLLTPTRGTIRILGRDPRDIRSKSRIGYLSEESALYPYLTAAETLDFYGRLFELNAAERKQRTKELLEMIGLTHARNRIVGEFSKGMTRRIGLAQALINDPDLILLDEPTAGLDPPGCRQVKDLLLALARRGKTVLLSSHLLADVETVCDRVAILYGGRLQAAGPVRELLEDRERSRIWLPSDLSAVRMKEILSGIRSLLGSEPEVDHPRKDLERFFLEVVERARLEAREVSTGAHSGTALAAFLTRSPPGADGRETRDSADENRNPSHA